MKPSEVWKKTKLFEMLYEELLLQGGRSASLISYGKADMISQPTPKHKKQWRL